MISQMTVVGREILRNQTEANKASVSVLQWLPLFQVRQLREVDLREAVVELNDAGSSTGARRDTERSGCLCGELVLLLADKIQVRDAGDERLESQLPVAANTLS